jgi:hypothetical protein
LRVEIADLTEMGFDVPLLGFTDEELATFSASDRAPEEFAEVGEDIQTEHQCPKCGYVWSGSTRVAKERTDGEE